MADLESRAQRATALEEKRRRLDDLKKRRDVRGQDTARVHASATANLDEYIDDLLKEPDVQSVAGKDHVPLASGKSNEDEDTPVLQLSNGRSDPQPAAGSTVDATSDLNVVAVSAPAPLPKLVETFSVSTQTDELEAFLVDELEEEDEREVEPKPNEINDTLQTIEEDKEPKILSPKEIEKEVTSRPFATFINTASKNVERMLGTPSSSDFIVDFLSGIDASAKRGGLSDASKDSSSKFLQTREVYECNNWTSGRDVTDIHWSPTHRELFLSTYHMNMSSAPSMQSKGQTAVAAIAHNNTLSSSLTPRSGELQSDGLLLIWNLSMPNRPENIVTCGSPVTTGRFHPTSTNLVIGGCESGQLVVWDLRMGRLPVQKSALTTVTGASSKGHTHPIGSIEIIEGSVSLSRLMHHGSCAH